MFVEVGTSFRRESVCDGGWVAKRRREGGKGREEVSGELDRFFLLEASETFEGSGMTIRVGPSEANNSLGRSARHICTRNGKGEGKQARERRDRRWRRDE